MSKGKPKQHKGARGGRKPPAGTIERQPRVHVKVACADMDLRAIGALVKPAVLYADTVTVYSPAALMVRSVVDFGAITGRSERMAAALQVLEVVPDLAAKAGLTPDASAKMQAFLRVPPSLVRAVARHEGGEAQLESLYAQLDGLQHFWDSDFPEALERIKDDMGARELFVALEAGLVSVADLPNSDKASMAGALRAATGIDDPADDLIAGFVASVIDVVEDKRAFPLLDDEAASLVRSLVRESQMKAPSTTTRGAEVASAASFMNFLPYFVDLPMDEAMSLRKELAGPLITFRAAIAGMSRDFASHPFDEAFAVEVEDAWRERVAPALEQIREHLAEQGLLQSVQAVTLGDARRLMNEAGAIVGLGLADVYSISGWLTAGVAAGVPAVDVVAKALNERRKGRSRSRENAMYFLHRLSEEATAKRGG